jgi:hypothetical protein
MPATARGRAPPRAGAAPSKMPSGMAWLCACKRPAQSIATERLASAIAGANPDLCRWHFAKIAAEAELELRRVRGVRQALLALSTSAGSIESGADHETHARAAVLLNLPRLDRYEQRALSRRNRALQLL